jgi:hypothetical protein
MDPQHCLEHDNYEFGLKGTPFCRARITVPGMVETFEKSYAGLKIAYPGDQGRLAEIDAQAAEQKKRFHGYVRRFRFERRVARAPGTFFPIPVVLMFGGARIFLTFRRLNQDCCCGSPIFVRSNPDPEFHPSNNRNRTVFCNLFVSDCLTLFKSKLGQKKLMFVLDPVHTIEKKMSSVICSNSS